MKININNILKLKRNPKKSKFKENIKPPKLNLKIKIEEKKRQQNET